MSKMPLPSLALVKSHRRCPFQLAAARRDGAPPIGSNPSLPLPPPPPSSSSSTRRHSFLPRVVLHRREPARAAQSGFRFVLSSCWV
ncbi:hypothetical protein GUJ93_ZPchr0011g27448 [Zizania palustris]|uniref:Uncharacterized protein n=1 Tax=Zizania palustris TaxID=103762 RepID=A0A8J5WEV6_ZIZPA|nr:hypothetical protein GUJ93_ZPchr0011g27448 [Zizania palustris]